MPEHTETLVVAGGCFWCVEGVFEEVNGVIDATSGYAGGTAETATYDAVSTGTTGHAEAVRLTYDPNTVSREDLLTIFFTVAHDPTQRNRQGPDIGPQYRSAVFYANETEKAAAEAVMRELQESSKMDGAFATTLEPLNTFYPAEDYHQDYAACNPQRPYVRVNVQPKVRKLRGTYPETVKPQE